MHWVCDEGLPKESHVSSRVHLDGGETGHGGCHRGLVRNTFAGSREELLHRLQLSPHNVHIIQPPSKVGSLMSAAVHAPTPFSWARLLDHVLEGAGENLVRDQPQERCEVTQVSIAGEGAWCCMVVHGGAWAGALRMTKSGRL